MEHWDFAFKAERCCASARKLRSGRLGAHDFLYRAIGRYGTAADIGQLVARRRQMHVTVADLTYQKEVESMLRATSGRLATWFGPSPTEPEFTINHAFGYFEVTVYYPLEYQRERVLVSELRSELENRSIQFSTEFPEELR